MEEHIEKSKTDARQSSRTGYMSRVLTISTIAAALILTIIYFFYAAG